MLKKISSEQLVVKKKIYTNTIGCVEAIYDENLYRKYLEENGWVITNDISSANIILLNTCGLRVDEVTQRISTYKKTKNSDAELIICGCFPFMNKEKFKEVFEGRYFSPRQPEKLAEFLQIDSSISETSTNVFLTDFFRERHPHKAAKLLIYFSEYINHIDSIFGTGFNNYLRRIGIFWYNSSMFYIRTSTGCMGKCSYCAIRFAKGKTKSLSTEKIINQFKLGLSQGKKEFVLSAEDVGSYGQDIGTNIAELLMKILAENGDYVIHVRYIDPYFLINYFDRLCDAFATGKIISFCSSVQSGSNKILKLMNKQYYIEQYLNCIKYINDNYPWMIVRTQVIVGFPQETNEDFSLTYDLFDKVAFNQVSIYQYKKYPYNPASDMEGHVSEETKKHRAKILKKKIGYRSISQTN